MAHASSFATALAQPLATAFKRTNCDYPVAPLGTRVWGLTIHSSRCRSAARLNSSVRPWCSKCVGGCRSGELAGVHAVGSGQQSSPLLVAVSSVLRLGTSFPRCAHCSWLRWRHARASLGKLPPASCGTLGPGGSAGEHGCTIQPLRPLTA